MNRHARILTVACLVLLPAATACSKPEKAEEKKQTSGSALAIGLNSVDPAHYGGWSGQLGGCEPDAVDMNSMALTSGLSSKLLLTAQAKRQDVLNEIAVAAAQLEPFDLFVLSYSGHGGQVPDANGDEDDHLDETWCLFDGQLLDDELYAALSKFAPGVRVLVFSDSCHSGTVVRLQPEDFTEEPSARDAELQADWANKAQARSMTTRATSAIPSTTKTFTPKALPPDVAIKTYRQNKAFYDQVAMLPKGTSRGDIDCNVILISGCRDNQLSSDIGTNGLFTLELEQVWNGGAFLGGHKLFQTRVRDAVLQSNPKQSPELFSVGHTVAGYEAQRPYTLFTP